MGERLVHAVSQYLWSSRAPAVEDKPSIIMLALVLERLAQAADDETGLVEIDVAGLAEAMREQVLDELRMEALRRRLTVTVALLHELGFLVPAGDLARVIPPWEVRGGG
jgi:hypothetical protein